MSSFTSVNGINAQGQIVGGHTYYFQEVRFTAVYYYSFIYDGSAFTPITGPTAAASAEGINDNGQIVGLYGNSTGTHGYFSVNGTLTTIDDPDATVANSMTYTTALGINNAGQIVGSFLDDGILNGFLDTNGTFTTIRDPLASPTPTPGGDGTSATGINNNGQIVGDYVDTTGVPYGFIDNSGTFTTISDPSAVASTGGTDVYGINDAGVIVGTYFDASSYTHGFVDNDGVYTTIDFPDAVNTFVTGINASGTIVGVYGDGLAFEATPVSPGATTYNFVTIDAPDSGGTLIETIGCLLAGTRIATVRGEVPVEDLVIGDTMLARFAGLAKASWIGHRTIDCRQHLKPEAVWPVRVNAHAFGDAMPHRDLWLSPDHAVFVDDVLVPVKYLVNGGTIVQVPVDEVTWYHVALPEHDLLLAHGLLVESYLDTGGFPIFADDDDATGLVPSLVACAPDDVNTLWETRSCAPLVIAGPRLDHVRRLVHCHAAATPRD